MSTDWPISLQLIGSKGLGGAERWFERFAEALAECGAPAMLAVRARSALDAALGNSPDIEPLPVYRLPFLTVWDPFSSGAVARLIKHCRPAVVQTYMGRATRLMRQRRQPGVPVPVHLARLGGYYKLAPYRHADGWIGNTRGLCDWMVAQGLPARRVYQIYNFVDRPRLRAGAEIRALRRRLGLHEDEWALVCLGRFVPVKGHRYLIDAVAKLPREIADRRWRLLLVGDGPLGPALRQQADASGVAERLLWVGWQPDPGPYLQLADLVVFPSLDAETLGNVILEAWAWRRPLVTASFRGAREIARHGEDVWCVPCANARALSLGIRRVLEEPLLAAALVHQGAERVEREFARDAIMRSYLELYTRLADA